MQGYLKFGESTIGRIHVQLWYNRFNEGREDINDEIVVIARTRQQPMKILKQRRKWFWIIAESLLERLLMRGCYDVGVSFGNNNYLFVILCVSNSTYLLDLYNVDFQTMIILFTRFSSSPKTDWITTTRHLLCLAFINAWSYRGPACSI